MLSPPATLIGKGEMVMSSYQTFTYYFICKEKKCYESHSRTGGRIFRKKKKRLPLHSSPPSDLKANKIIQNVRSSRLISYTEWRKALHEAILSILWGGKAGKQMIRGSFTLPGKVGRCLWRNHSLLQTCSFTAVKPRSAWLYGGCWWAVSFRADLACVTNVSCQWQTSPQAEWPPGSVSSGSRWSLIGRSRACRVKQAQPPCPGSSSRWGALEDYQMTSLLQIHLCLQLCSDQRISLFWLQTAETLLGWLEKIKPIRELAEPIHLKAGDDWVMTLRLRGGAPVTH